jgi:hypothetical protein
MNAVEIEAAVSELAAQPFDAGEFPFQFLTAFGNKETTLKRLRKGDSNASDIPGGVLQRGNIHLATCARGETASTLQRLRESARTAAAKAKFIFATDGAFFEAEDIASGVPIADDLSKLADHFGYFLQLAGISTVREIKDNPIDVRATGRLNKLYVELLRLNPDWGTAARRHEMNHFMARLIFCYFAEHTDIFNGSRLFTDTVEQMSEADGGNTHRVIGEMFRAMNVKIAARTSSGVPPYANQFPYVNGGLFSGGTDVPLFSRIARSYLIQAGKLEWDKINPDIFGSMIQAVADDEERGALGMHYTSVPNILKVLNPLFLDDLRAQLEAAGDNSRMLLNLRRRLSRIRIFDPACGSGNFLVIAYKQMRSIEAKINSLRGEPLRKSDISKRNFRGIELRDFAAEIARLALVIAEYQCDVAHRGPLAAKAEFLPLDEMNWIVRGNALQLDWLEVCPPEGAGVKLNSDDLFQTPLDQVAIDFENQGGETFICGNPPYKGATQQTADQKEDMRELFATSTDSWKSLDYVCGWYMKFARYFAAYKCSCSLVSTNSITQGEQVARLWPLVLSGDLSITFAYTSFRWANMAAQNAGVTVVIVGLGVKGTRDASLFQEDGGTIERRQVPNINAYLVPYANLYIETSLRPSSAISDMTNGNKPADGGHLIMTRREAATMRGSDPRTAAYIRPFIGAAEAVDGSLRYCLWLTKPEIEQALQCPDIQDRVKRVKDFRSASMKLLTQAGAETPYAFQQVRQHGGESVLVVPRVTSENRPYLPVMLGPLGAIIGDRNFALYDAPLWNMALIASRLHWVWIGTVCVRLEMRFSYSNTLGWNTFPVPTLTEQNKADLTRCAENILLAREAHFPKTIADLYDPEDMPANLRQAHEQNDETLERIYLGRRFRNDSERLEKLFSMYTEMQDRVPTSNPKVKRTKTQLRLESEA